MTTDSRSIVRLEMIIDDPEEEAWKDLEQRQKVVPRHERVLDIDDSFEDYLKTPGVTVTSRAEARRVFSAGWVYAIRNQWAKERNN